LAIVDIDGTLYRGFSLAELIQHEELSFVDNAYRHQLERLLEDISRGEMAYEAGVDMVIRLHAQALAGRQIGDAEVGARGFFSTTQSWFGFAAGLVKTLSQSHDVYLVTGELQFIARAAREVLGATGFRSSEATVRNGTLTGAISVSLATGAAKAHAVSDLLATYGRPNSIGIGDSVADLEFLDLVERSALIDVSRQADGFDSDARSHQVLRTEPEVVRWLAAVKAQGS
jgi:phosphoserine phosphatase